jgi:hypothetical protein
MSGVPLIYDLYPSKPLESWDKARELRRKLFWDIWKGKERLPDIYSCRTW